MLMRWYTLIKADEELCEILKELIKNAETECVEFKRAENNFDIDRLGKYFSAISNKVTLKK